MKISIKELPELSINKYRDILEILKNDEDEVTKSYEVISSLTDLSLDELKKYDYDSIQLLYSYINNVLSIPITTKYSQSIKVKGQRLFFRKDLNNMSFGQFLDLYNLTKDPDSIMKNLHIIMAIMYRKYNKYNSETVMNMAPVLADEMNIHQALNACFFFLNLKKKLLSRTLASLVKQ